MIQNNPELFELSMSEKTQPLMDLVKHHCEENIKPIQAEYSALQNEKEDRWSWHPRQIELMEGAKDKARELGLWNFFLPDPDGNIGDGLTNLDYTYVATEIGKYPLASESMNCSAPDTGNMEIIHKFGTPDQKKRFLEPLMNKDIRSAYAMTEPGVASSDATNISTRIEEDGDDLVINGHKWWISGSIRPECKLLVVMGKSKFDGPRHQQQTMVLVPKDTPGVKIVRALSVFGHRHISKTEPLAMITKKAISPKILFELYSNATTTILLILLSVQGINLKVLTDLHLTILPMSMRDNEFGTDALENAHRVLLIGSRRAIELWFDITSTG